MPSLLRKLLTAGLLAIYSGIAVLGYGLHELAPGHHHGPAGECLAHDHGHGGHGHGACESHSHSHAASSPCGESISDSHECEICVFLAQIRSERPTLATEIVWQYQVAAVDVETPRILSQAIPGLHAPRGPPNQIG
jgi:hypothetical protein